MIPTRRCNYEQLKTREKNQREKKTIARPAYDRLGNLSRDFEVRTAVEASRTADPPWAIMPPGQDFSPCAHDSRHYDKMN